MSYLGKKPSPDIFAKWSKPEHIFLCPDVAFLVPTKTMGAGVFARCPLPTGTVVISCPSSASISPYELPSITAPSVEVLHGCTIVAEGEKTLTSSSSDRKTKVHKMLRTPKHNTGGSPPSNTLLSNQDPFLFVVMRLMAELCRKRSPYRPWLEACPRMPQHFFNLDATQNELLLGASIPEDDGSETAKLRRDSRTWTGVSEQLAEINVSGRWAMAQTLMRDYPEIWPDKVPDSTETPFELFCECLAHVSSRNFHREELQGREGPYLLPGLDFLNHSFTPNTKFEIRGGGRKHESSFTVVTTKPLAKGEQVYVSYGLCGAARMVTQFQFVNESVRIRDKIRFSVDVLIGIAMRLRKERMNSPEHAAAEDTKLLEKDLEKRVDHLQRIGVVYDEGLYLSRPLTTNAEVNTFVKEYAFEDYKDQDEDENQYVEEVRLLREEVRYFLTTFYLLVAVDGPSFDDIYRRMNKAWVPSDEKLVNSIAARALEEKIAAAQSQDEKVDEVFAGPTNTIRRALLHGALNSEIESLKFFLTSFFVPQTSS